MSDEGTSSKIESLESAVERLQRCVLILLSRDLVSTELSMAAITGDHQKAKQALSEIRETNREIRELIELGQPK